MPNFPQLPTANSLIEAPAALPGERPKSLVGLLTNPWILWFQEVVTWLQRTSQRYATVDLTAQSASIASTAIPTGNLSAAKYRLTYYARITRAGSVSSSLTPALNWLDGGVSCTFTGAAMTGNTTATTQSGTVTFKSDAASAINYSTVYASAGATTAQYSLLLVLESMS